MSCLSVFSPMAGGKVLETNTTGSSSVWGYPALNDTEFLAVATAADVFVYSAGNFSWAYSAKQEVLDQVPAVAARRVVDTLGRGENDWFESREAEPDVLLEDLTAVITPAAIDDHTRVWLRDPFSEASGAVNQNQTCQNASYAKEPLADTCTRMSVKSSSTGGVNREAILAGVLVPVAVVLLATIALVLALRGRLAPVCRDRGPDCVRAVPSSLTANSRENKLAEYAEVELSSPTKSPAPGPWE